LTFTSKGRGGKGKGGGEGKVGGKEKEGKRMEGA